VEIGSARWFGKNEEKYLKEHEYMNRLAAKEYVPERLFDDEAIEERIKEHLMEISKLSMLKG
jgi:hypothetical protein